MILVRWYVPAAIMLSLALAAAEEGCDAGWYGVNCTKQCHCFQDDCEDQILQECPNGCVRGWKGKQCDLPEDQSAVTVNYFCFNQAKRQLVLLFIDQKGLNFHDVAAVDSEGNIDNECNKNRFIGNMDGGEIHINIYTKLPQEPGFESSNRACSGKAIDNSTVQWTFRLQQFNNIESIDDEDVQIVCNFSNADALYDTHQIDVQQVESPGVSPISFNPSTVSVDMYLATPSLERLDSDEIHLGLIMVLVVSPVKGNGTSVVSLSPRNCQAQTHDGKLVKKLTDHRGCAVSKTGFNKLYSKNTEQGIMFVSGEFKAFTFPGYDNVDFNCDFTPCLKYNEDTCLEPCSASE